MADEEENPGNKRNIIVTYAELAAIAQGVAVLNIKVDGVNTALADMAKQHDDHEVRLRALELTQQQFIAAKGTVAGMWGVGMALVALLFTALSYFKPLAM